MTKRKRTKHYTENQRPNNTNPTKNWGRIQVLWEANQFLLHE
jgi:hypothetical protein